MVIKGDMRLRFLKSLVTYGILILYVLIPILDSMVCAGCLDNEPFQCETSIGCLQAPYDEVVYTSHDGTQSNAPISDEYAAKPFCSICANFLMGVDVFSPNTHLVVTQWDGPSDVTALSEFHYSIYKPPQNLLA